MKKLLITCVMAAMISSAMLSACGSNDQASATAETVSNTTSAVKLEEETTATAPTLSDNEKKAVTEAGLTIDRDGYIIDKTGKKLQTDADGKVEITNTNGKKIKIDAAQIKKASNTTSSQSQKAEKKNKDESSKAKSSRSESSKSENKGSDNSSSSKSESSKNNSKNGTSSSKTESSKSESSKAESSRSESSKPESSKTTSSSKTESSKAEPKPTKHTHSWQNITSQTKVKVVDKEAYTYEEPVYKEQGRTFCKVCGADITDNCSEHNEQHALKGENVSYCDKWVTVQVGTKTVKVPEKSHYETKTEIVGRKCTGCGKVEKY